MKNLLNKIHFFDCFQLMAQIPNDSVDLVVVDPPYGIGYGKWDCFESQAIFLLFCHRWLYECFRVLKPEGTMWSFMGAANAIEFVPILRNYGNVHLENWVVWARQKGRMSSKHLKSSREDIFHITKSKKFTWNNLKVLREVICPYMKDGKPRGWFIDENGKRVRWTGLGNVWTYTSPFWKSKTDKLIHSAQKPFLVIERLVLLSSNKGDVVLDPFSGSGITAVVCEKTKRNYICIENDKEYYSSSVSRLETFRNENKKG